MGGVITGMRKLVKTKADVDFLRLNGIGADSLATQIEPKLLSRFSKGTLYGIKEGLNKYNKSIMIDLKDVMLKLYKVNLATSVTISLLQGSIEDAQIYFSASNLLKNINKSSFALLNINQEYVDALHKYKVKDQIIYDSFINNLEFLKEKSSYLGNVLMEYLPLVGLVGYNTFLESRGTTFVEDVYNALETFLEKCPKFEKLDFPNSGGEKGNLYDERLEVYKAHLEEMFSKYGAQRESNSAAVEEWKRRSVSKTVNTFKTIKALRVDMTSEYKSDVQEYINKTCKEFEEINKEFQHYKKENYKSFLVPNTTKRLIYDRLLELNGSGLIIVELHLTRKSKNRYSLKYVENIEDDEFFLGLSMKRVMVLDSKFKGYIDEVINEYNQSNPDPKRALFYYEFNLGW